MARSNASDKSGPASNVQKSAAPKYGIRSVGLALELMEAVVAANGRFKGVTELSREVGTNKWRVHRHLHTLREHGYLAQDPETDRFELGDRLYHLVAAVPRRFEIQKVARPAIQILQQQVGHTVLVTGVDNAGLVIVDTEAGNASVRMVIAPGLRIIMNASAQGKVGLAFGPDHFLTTLLASPLPALTKKSIVSPSKLKAEVALVKRRGWASAPEETQLDLNFVAVPIFGTARRLVGTLAVMNTMQALPPKPSPVLLKQLLDASASMTAQLNA